MSFDREDSEGFFSKARTILAVIGICFITGIIVVAVIKGSDFIKGMTSDEDHNVTVNVTVIESKLVKCGELTTLKYEYTDVAEIEDYRQVGGKNIPLTGHNIQLTYSGTIHAGVDLSKIKQRVSLVGNKIIVKLPDIEVFDNSIDNESVKTVEKNNILNTIKSDEVSKKLAEEEERQLKLAEEKGLYEKAEKNAEEEIRKQLSIFKDYTVEFK